MFENDRKETVSKAVKSIWFQSNIEKSTSKTHRYFVDFESRIHVELSTSNRCHNFHVDSPFKIDEIFTNFPRRISMSNRWQIDEDVFIGLYVTTMYVNHYSRITWLQEKGKGISLTPHYPFHSLHWQLGIRRVITAASSPLHKGSRRNRAGNFWFPSARR